MRKRAMSLETLNVKPSFGSIVKMKRSTCLYIDIYYQERRIRMSSGLADTTESREKLTKFLNKIGEKIEHRTFCFAETFPDADNELKRFFTEKEKREYHPEPEHVTFGQYANKWMETVLPKYSHSKQVDYQQDLDYWIIPFLGKIPFARITGPLLRSFVNKMQWKDGKNEGKPLSAHRRRNIMIPLRAVWDDACDDYGWDLRDPFKAAKKEIKEHADQVPKKEREIFLLWEWVAFLSHMDPFYHPLTEIQILTGLIASELRGLRKEDVTESFLYVRSTISRGVEKKGGKTQYRKRAIPMTKAMRKCFSAAMATSPTEYVFTMADGKPVNFNMYRDVWDKALLGAGLTNKTPYSTRHSLVQWSLVAGITPVRLVEVMGHRDKQMIFNTYGRYRHGLVEERQAILGYLGEDFLDPEKASALAPHSETFSETQGPKAANYLKIVGF